MRIKKQTKATLKIPQSKLVVRFKKMSDRLKRKRENYLIRKKKIESLYI